MSSFDAYHRWLGIPPEEQPPHHYRLLGLTPLESDPEVIASASERQMAHVRNFQAGEHSARSQEILNELAAAELCLLCADKKVEYDAQLRARLAAERDLAMNVARSAAESAATPELVAQPPADFTWTADAVSGTKLRWQVSLAVLSALAILIALQFLVLPLLERSRQPAAIAAETSEPGDSQEAVASENISHASSALNPVQEPLNEFSPTAPPPSNEPPTFTASLAIHPERTSPPAASPPANNTTSPPNNTATGARVEPPSTGVNEPMVTVPPVTEPAQPEMKAPSADNMAAADVAPKTDTPPRWPPPEPSAQQAARERMRDVFGTELLGAATNAAKLALAAKIYRQACDTRDDRAARFVLFEQARSLALEGGDLKLALATIDALGADFAVDLFELKNASLAAAGPTLRSPAAQQTLAALAFIAAEEAALTDQFEQAQQMLATAIAAAKKAHDQQLVKYLESRDGDWKALQLAYAQLEPTRKALEKNPADPAAALAEGRFYCLAKGDWKRGLAWLSGANDEQLKSLAGEDRGEPVEPADQVQLADRWWEFANTAADQENLSFRRRAQYWYARALPYLTGLTKARVQKRLDETGVAASAQPVGAVSSAGARPQQLKWSAASQLPIMRIDSQGRKLVLIPPGEFSMGSSLVEKGREGDELQHRVRITRPFYFAAHEVTVRQYNTFLSDTGQPPWASSFNRDDNEKEDNREQGRGPPPGRGPQRSRRPRLPDDYSLDSPAVHVSWDEALAFCQWLGKKESAVYRLPTEAEWEFACRAGATHRFSNGDDQEGLIRVGNVLDASALAVVSWSSRALRSNDGYLYPAPVGQFAPNHFGLFDMHGNAAEWCWDWYAEDYYSRSPSENPRGPDTGVEHVIRGGSWLDAANDCRCAARDSGRPDEHSDRVGFRVVREPY